MRGKRSKQYRKAMHAYALSFGFREPYQILLDADFIKDAARFKMKLGAMLEGTVHGTIKPMITQCCIRHLYTAEVESDQKAEKEGWIEVAKQAARQRCGHHELEEPLSALECIKSVVDPKDLGTNKGRFVVASQQHEIRATMRQIAGVPLIYINRSVMILEPLAAKTEKVREVEEIGKRKAGLRGRPELVVEKRKREDAEEDANEKDIPKRKKPKGPKQPNPLSMKKAKKPVTVASKSTDGATISKPSKEEEVKGQESEQDTDALGQTQALKKRKRKRKPAASTTMISEQSEETGFAHDNSDGDEPDD